MHYKRKKTEARRLFSAPSSHQPSAGSRQKGILLKVESWIAALLIDDGRQPVCH
jgi:hypothetical protein